MLSVSMAPSRPVFDGFCFLTFCGMLAACVSTLVRFCVLESCLRRCFLVSCCGVVSCRVVSYCVVSDLCFYSCCVAPDCIVGNGRLRSLFREHKSVILMLRVQSIRDVVFSDTSLSNDKIPITYFPIITTSQHKYAPPTSSVFITNL
jgi:hypothetical protein